MCPYRSAIASGVVALLSLQGCAQDVEDAGQAEERSLGQRGAPLRVSGVQPTPRPSAPLSTARLSSRTPYSWAKFTAFTPDGTTLAVAEADIKFWDAHTGRLKSTLKYQGVGSALVNSIAVSPDRKLVALLTDNSKAQPDESGNWKPPANKVLLLSATTGKVVRAISIQYAVGPLSFSPNGKLVACSELGRVQLYSVPSGHAVRQFPIQKQPGAGVGHFVGFSSDSRTLVAFKGDAVKTLDSAVSGWNRAYIQFWDVHSGRLKSQRMVPAEAVTGPYNHSFYDVAPDGGAIAVGVNDTLKLWDGRTGNLLWEHTDPRIPAIVPGGLRVVEFSADGKLLASFRQLPVTNNRVPAGFEVRIWDVRTGKVRRVLPTHPRIRVETLCFSPQGRFLVGAGHGMGPKGSRSPGAVQIWDLQMGKLLYVL